MTLKSYRNHVEKRNNLLIRQDIKITHKKRSQLSRKFLFLLNLSWLSNFLMEKQKCLLILQKTKFTLAEKESREFLI